MKKNIGVLNKLSLQAGLLNDGMGTTEEVVMSPDEQAEVITTGAENVIIPEVAETESLLNEVVAEDENISEELADVAEEQAVATEGLQTDFTAVTTRAMIKSIEKINKRYGEGSIVTSGLQSDKFGGHKDLYIAGLLAKESFLKEAGKNILALIASFVEKIKELGKKVSIFLNQDAKSATALIASLKTKTDKLKNPEVTKLDEKELAAIGNKFGAYLAVGLKLNEYPSVMSKILAEDIILDIKALDKTPIGSSRQTLDKAIKDSGIAKEYENAYGVSVLGKNIKLLSTDGEKLKVDTITVTDEDLKDKVPAEIPSLDLIVSFATAAVKLATSLKSYADNSWKTVDEFKAYLKDASQEDAAFNVKKNAVIAANQIAMANLSFYTGAQKSMIWFAGAFANKYEGNDVKKPATEKPAEKK